jgi:hypothetical protein
VIIKGGSRGRSAQLAAHLLRTDQNEQVELREFRGTVATSLLGALEEIEATADSTRCRKPFYHASISPSPDRPLTARQWSLAVEALERALGLKGQPRIVVAHVKGKRQHVHVVWSRIDIERGRAIADSWNFRVHEEVARSLEHEFGHEAVRGAFTGRENQQPRPRRTPRLGDQRQEQRSGICTSDVQAEITAAWRSSASGDEFRERLRDAGYILARGDRRTFVVVDAAGGVHALARRIDGVRTRDLHARFAEGALAGLPSVAGARATMQDRRTFIAGRGEVSSARYDRTSRVEFTSGRAAAASPGASPRDAFKREALIATALGNNRVSQPQIKTAERNTTARNGIRSTRATTKPLSSLPGTLQANRNRSKDRRTSTYAQERGVILLLYAAKIAAAQLYSPKDQLAAIVNALKAEERAALSALREREAVENERQKRTRLLQAYGLAARGVTSRSRPGVRPMQPAKKELRNQTPQYDK